MGDETRSEGGALAWHSDLEMTVAERDEFLSGRWVARIATNGADGFPRVTPAYYYWDGRHLYVSLTSRRVAGRNLLRDPRCSVVIDIDERPLSGMGRNYAMAVTMKGEVEIYRVAEKPRVTVMEGPWRGEHDAGDFLVQILARYGLWSHDGVVEGSHDQVFAMLGDADGSRVVEDNQDRLLVRLVPHVIQSWDFSRAPLLPRR